MNERGRGRQKQKQREEEEERERERDRDRSERGLTSFQLVFELLNASLVGKNSVSGWPARAQTRTHIERCSAREKAREERREEMNWNWISVDSGLRNNFDCLR